MLTNSAVKATGARSGTYKLSDEHGLSLFVTPAGARSSRMNYQLPNFGL